MNNQINSLRKRTTKSLPLTIRNDKLASVQKRRVLLFNLIPLLGCVLAIIQVAMEGISWLNISLFLTMYFFTVIGGTVGYHRYLAHKSFQTDKVIQTILIILGGMSGQGPPIYWVGNHRRHHQYSDRPEDPHSPHISKKGSLGRLEGLWQAHVGWLFEQEITNSLVFAKDLLQQPLINWLNQKYLYWMWLGLLIPTLIGGMITHSWMGALSGLLWGGLVRLFFSIQYGYVTNSITHVYGSRPFKTDDQSTNNIWLAIPTGGEAWHNNHHAFPNSSKFGLQWWQIDLGYWVIRTLEIMGLVWDVKYPNQKMIEAKRVNRKQERELEK